MLSPHVGRLEGLAGLSVQDAELKLFADNPKPKGDEGSPARNGRSHADGTVGCGTTTNQAQGGEEGLGAETGGSASKKKTRNKNKAEKKKLAIIQRGPLLITHSGEGRFPILPYLFFSGPSATESARVARELIE